MKREKTPVCTSVAELLSIIEKEALQMEELAKALEGTYTRHIEYCNPKENENVTSIVTYNGLEYNERQGIRAIVKFQDTYVRDIDGKVSKNTVTVKYNVKDLQWAINKHNSEYKKI